MSDIGRVALLGAGVAGAGWAARFAVNGIDVRVHDPDSRAASPWLRFQSPLSEPSGRSSRTRFPVRSCFLRV